MWVAIDCRSKNWVAVLKSLGSTDLEHHPNPTRSRRIKTIISLCYWTHAMKRMVGVEV
jgi:hypothetical protein